MLTAGAVILDVYRRQRLRTVLATLGMVGHQTCEALVPVAFGLVIDRAVRTGDGGAMWLSSVGILLLFTALTFSARGGHWMATKAILEESHRRATRRGTGRRAGTRPWSSTAFAPRASPGCRSRSRTARSSATFPPARWRPAR